MVRRRNLRLAVPILALSVSLAGCGGAVSSGSFDRTYEVSGPIRLDVTNASGSVHISASADNKVHIHGEIRAHRFPFNDASKQAKELSANPPIEQKPDIIRVGKELARSNGAAIEYTIGLPRNAEVATTVASGSLTISDIQGPVKIESSSGSIAVSKTTDAPKIAQRDVLFNKACSAHSPKNNIETISGKLVGLEKNHCI